MAGAVQHAKLDSPTARAKLITAAAKRVKHEGRGEPERGLQHWQTLITGRAHLGYQRKPGAASGRWILRRYDGEAYKVEPLGLADDDNRIDADGVAILTYEQAKAKALAALDTSAEGKPYGRLTVSRAVANYIDFLTSKGKQTKDTEWRVAAHIIPKLGNIEVAALTSDKIRKWLHALASAPAFVRTKEGKKQNYKAAPGDDEEAVRRRRSSANRVLNILKAALNHAYDEEHVTSRDAWGRRVTPFEDVDVARIRYLKVPEAKRLLNACDPEFRPIAQAALETGCRYGELTRLEVQDFNPDAGTLHIRKSKNGRPRHVVLNDEGTAFFRQVCAGRPGSALMFARADGGPWRASHQSRPMKEANENAKLSPPITFHGLRHTWASLAVMNGVPLLLVARNLGHLNRDGQPHTRMVEKHYAHLTPDFAADAIRAGAPKFGFKPDKKIATLTR